MKIFRKTVLKKEKVRFGDSPIRVKRKEDSTVEDSA
jgi:hypothetical protein